MLRLRYLLLTLILLLPALQTNAASSRSVISFNNIVQLQRVRLLGKGVLGEVKWSPDGITLAVGSTTGIWLYDSHNFQREPRWLGNRDFPAMRLAFSPDGRKLVGYNRLTKISVWNVATQQLEREFTFEKQGFEAVTNTGSGFEYSPVYDVSYTAQGQLLVTSALPKDYGYHVWDAYTGQDIILQKGVDPAISSVSYAPDGQTVAFGIAHDLYEPGEVQLWSLKTGRLVSTLSGPTSPINGVAYSRDGRYLASGGGAVPSDYADADNDNTARIWDAKTGKLLQLLAGHTYWVETVALSSDDQLLASGSGDNTIRLWTVRDGKLKSVLKGHTGWISNVLFSPNNKWLASTAGDGTVRLWDVKTSVEIARLTDFSGDPSIYVGPGGSGSPFDMGFSADSASIAAILGGSTFKVWNSSSGKEQPAPAMPAGLSPQAKLKALADPRLVKMWKQIPGGQRAEAFFTATFSPDRKYMLIPADGTQQEGRITQLWMVNPQKLIAVFPFDPWYEAMVFSPDSKLVIMMTINGNFSGYDTSIIAYDTATANEAWRATRLAFRFSGVGAVSSWQFSADGKWLGAIWNDGYITITDLKIGWLDQSVDLRHQDNILRGVFTPDLGKVAYIQYDGDSKYVDVATKDIQALSGDPVGFTLDHRILFTAIEDKLSVWNVQTGQLIKTFQTRGQIAEIKLSSDGTLIAVADQDDVIEMWAVSGIK